MILTQRQKIGCLNQLDDVHGEFQREEQKSMRPVHHCMPLYQTHHLLLHEVSDTFSGLIIGPTATLLSLDILDDFLELRFELGVQEILLLDLVRHAL